MFCVVCLAWIGLGLIGLQVGQPKKEKMEKEKNKGQKKASTRAKNTEAHRTDYLAAGFLEGVAQWVTLDLNMLDFRIFSFERLRFLVLAGVPSALTKTRGSRKHARLPLTDWEFSPFLTRVWCSAEI